MDHVGLSGIWLVLSVGFGCLAMALALCRVCLKRRVEAIHALWDDIYVRIVERCNLVGTLSDHLRKQLAADTKIVDDIRFLLKRMSETNDPNTHAAVQNGLILTVQTAVEQFHRSDEMQIDSALAKTMQLIGAVDSQLAPLRDRYNHRIQRYNVLLNTLPFSIVAWLAHTPERAQFLMLIPWWSTNAYAYGGGVSTDDIRLTLQTRHAPIVLAPSQRTEWQGSKRVIRVAHKLPGGKPPTSDGTLSVSADPAEGGTVTGAGTYNHGDTAPVTASPTAGWEFVNWTGPVADPNAASTTVLMDDDKAVVAHFPRITHSPKPADTRGRNGSKA